MKELKFICPLCGQHIQCDWRHAGENVPCPGCAALIRVPGEGDVTDVPSPQPEDNPFATVTGDTEKVSYSPANPATSTEQKKSTAAVERAVPTPAAPLPANQAPPAAPDQGPSVTARTIHAPELHSVCPVCQSALRILVEPEPHLGDVHPAAPTGAEQLPLNERERLIAAARERTLHSTTAKPRLDRILGDHAAETSPPSEKK